MASMGHYREHAALWVEESPGKEGLDPEAVHVLYEECQYREMNGQPAEVVKDYLRGVWKFYRREYLAKGRGEDAAWMVAVEKMAANVK